MHSSLEPLELFSGGLELSKTQRDPMATHRAPTPSRALVLVLAGALALGASHCRSAPNHEVLPPNGPGRPAASGSAAEEPQLPAPPSAAPFVPPSERGSAERLVPPPGRASAKRLVLPGSASAAPSAAIPAPAPAVLDALDAPLVAKGAPRRVLVIGDSLSDFRVGGGGYLRALERACPTVTVDNRARGGWMVNQMRRRFEAELPPMALTRFTDAVVFGGVNDVYSDQTAGRNFEKITRDLQALYRALKAARVRVVAMTLSPWGGFSRYYNAVRGETTARVNAWIEEQRQNGLVDVVIDAHTLLACGDPERLCPDYARAIDDGLHFGPKGHERLGAALIERAFPECAGAPH